MVRVREWAGSFTSGSFDNSPDDRASRARFTLDNAAYWRGPLGGAECLAKLPTLQQSLGLQLQLPYPLARDLKLLAKLG